MKKQILTLIIFFYTLFCFSQKADTLYLNYYEHFPFASADNGEVKGIEIDIIKEYTLWLKTKKNLSFVFKYNAFNSFDQFYTKTKSANKNTIGLGSVTINADRAKEVDFTSAYLKNVAYCITNGNAPEIKTKTADEVIKALGSMTALTLTNTTLNKYVNEIKKLYVKDLKVKDQTSEIQILDEISKNVLYFGYVDAVGFWLYLKNNPQKFIKTQKAMSLSNEELAFLLPKGSGHKVLFNEFFSGTTGFKKSKAYLGILEKYLGAYMAQSMAVQ